MPIYHYQPVKGNCRLCGKGFDHVQPAAEAPLQECPKCGLAVVRKDVNEIQVPQILKKVGPVAARNAGFTMLKKSATGEYERLN